MQETEITVQVLDSLDNITRKLAEQGFVLKKERLMNDWYYTKYDMDAFKQMSYADMIANSFMVRRIVDDKDLKLLTYKKKVLDSQGSVIAEEKIECKIDSVDHALNILDAARLNCWSRMEQRMLIYTKENIEFALQIVDGLGIFIEYEEDDTMLGLDEYAKIKHMADTLRRLGLKLGDDLSCKKVYLKFKREHD